ncbi:MAG: class I SAM-dependent methyltransferase [Candidatus Omnitrophota bacterium]|jgi:hypothetical protein
MNIKKCRICGSQTKILFKDGADFFLLNGQSPAFGVDYCHSCEIGFSFPALSLNEFSIYYPDDFEAYVPKKTFWGVLQKIKYRSDLKKLSEYLDLEQKSLFEVGAGRGEFLREAKDRGFDVAGIEPGARGVKFAASQYGIHLEQAFVSEMQFEKQYHVVVARHVLEHLDEFYEYLQKIYQEGLLKGGILFLKLPRFDSWEAKKFGRFWHGFDLPRHRVHFTKNGLSKILKNIGFDKISIKGEVVAEDMIRSLHYCALHAGSGVPKMLIRYFDLLPHGLKFVICQLVGYLLWPWGAGRMIIIARRP